MGARAGEALSYEQVRQRKLEENKKKLEELNLGHLCIALRQAITSPKTSPAKQTKRKINKIGSQTALRRSVRVAKLTGTNYREVASASDVLQSPRATRAFKRRCLFDRIHSYEARLYAQLKAEDLQSRLVPKFPSFIKLMLPSHTSGGFWLGLPSQFSSEHLPSCSATVTLVDETGEEFETIYLAHKKGLSGGWKGFSESHELVDGDALVFQLIDPTTFQVYIIRASSYDGN